jgi:hypothetical protein
MAPKKCHCSNCLQRYPNGKCVSERTFYRHQHTKLQPRKEGAFHCQCVQYPNGHYFASRTTLRRHTKWLTEQEHADNAYLPEIANQTSDCSSDNVSTTDVSHPSELFAEDYDHEDSEDSEDFEVSEDSEDSEDFEVSEDSEDTDGAEDPITKSYTHQRHIIDAFLDEDDRNQEDQTFLDPTKELDKEADNSLDLFFQLVKWSEGIPRSKYAELQDILQKQGVYFPSIRYKAARLEKVTRIRPQLIDCCYNNCIAYTGQYTNRTNCPECEAPRCGPTGKSRKRFVYIPITHRLQLQYRDPVRAGILKDYRLSRLMRPRRYGDFFDGNLFHDFHMKELGLFKDPHDIALHVSLDGVQLTNMRHYEVTPVILVNLNLPPEIRYQAQNILTSLIIPGPKKAKDLDSFLQPLVSELLQLDNGVDAFDSHTNTPFKLRAWATLVTGDGPALASVSGMKAPGNAFRPCRTCTIEGKSRGGRHKTYYVPHSTYNFSNPPIRTDVRETIKLVAQSHSSEESKFYGIARASILLRLRSVHFNRSFPADIMHGVLQNVVPGLFSLWNRTKLAIDDVRHGNPHEPYYLKDSQLESISNALHDSRGCIPTYLGHAPRKIKDHYRGYKASEWAAWLQYFGVPLLDQHIGDEHVANFRQLGQFYTLATRHSLTERDVLAVQQLAIEFVRTYERLYYREDSMRLSVCTINVHQLLHFADYIRDCGPACYWWQFVMERYCGIIKPKARSKSQLDASLINAVVTSEHLNHLSFARQITSAIAKETTYPVLLDHFHIQLKRQQERQLRKYVSEQQLKAGIKGYKRAQLSQRLIIGSHRSQRRSDLNRCNHRICFRPSPRQPMKFAEVGYFVGIPGFGDLAWIQELTDIDVDKEKGIISYKSVAKGHRWIQVEWIQSLIGVIEEARVKLIVSDIGLLV